MRRSNRWATTRKIQFLQNQKNIIKSGKDALLEAQLINDETIDLDVDIKYRISKIEELEELLRKIEQMDEFDGKPVHPMKMNVLFSKIQSDDTIDKSSISQTRETLSYLREHPEKTTKKEDIENSRELLKKLESIIYREIQKYSRL